MKSLIDNLKAVAGKAQFASLTYTTKIERYASGKIKKGGETSRYVVILGANYLNLLEKSLVAAQVMDKTDLILLFAEPDATKNIPIEKLDEVLNELELARVQVIESLIKSIHFHQQGLQNPDYTKAGQYIPLGGGLSLNENDLTLQLFGLEQSKVVLEKGVYKSVDSAPLTIAKNVIRKSLPIGKFREFALDLGNIHKVKLNGNVLEIEPKKKTDLKKKYQDIHKPKVKALGGKFFWVE